jgi:hypothetical protein
MVNIDNVLMDMGQRHLEQGCWGAKGSRKNNFTFYVPLHPDWLRCECSEYA